jgi:large-conductance mechanosensitive channel
MAGIISGIVAYTTIQLGIGGTVIGAVLGSMLYQFMSHFVRDPLGKVKTQKIEASIVYTLPLLLILGIEIIYFMAPIYWRSEQIFYFLEGATGWNLFRTIGLGLIIMGIYPIFQSEFVKKRYGAIISTLGIIVLLRGFIDVHSPLVNLYYVIFTRFDDFISLMVIFVLIYVIFAILKESISLIREKDDESDSTEENKNNKEEVKEKSLDEWMK